MFPGQASQYVGMGKSLYERHESVQQRFTEASEVLGFDLAELCFNGAAQNLTKTENTQPAILVLSIAMFEVAQKEGLQPSFLAGHSLGEISALTASGVLKFADAVKLAHLRGKAMANCSTGSKTGMSAVTKIEANVIEPIIKQLEAEGHSVQIANYNTPTQTVLSGSAEGLKIAEERLNAIGAKVIPLNVGGPFHSRFMSGAEEAMRSALELINLGEMKIPVINGLEGRLYTKDDDIKAALVSQLTGPVRWTTVLNKLYSEGIELWLEMGPKDVLKKLTLQTLPDVKAYAYDKEADSEDIRKQLDMIIQRKRQMPSLFGLCLGAAVCTRNINWDEVAYQKGVIEPYNEIQKLNEHVEKEGSASEEQMRYALDLLRQIFVTKGAPKEEQLIRFRQILTATETDKLFPKYMISAEEDGDGNSDF